MHQLPPELVGRAVQDSEFRRRLLTDPEDVAAREGYDLSPEQIQAIRDMDADAVDKAIDAMLGDLATSKWG